MQTSHLKPCPHCRRSETVAKSAKVAEFRRCLAVLGDSLTFLRQCGQALTVPKRRISSRMVITHSFHKRRALWHRRTPFYSLTAWPTTFTRNRRGKEGGAPFSLSHQNHFGGGRSGYYRRRSSITPDGSCGLGRRQGLLKQNWPASVHGSMMLVTTGHKDTHTHTHMTSRHKSRHASAETIKYEYNLENVASLNIQANNNNNNTERSRLTYSFPHLCSITQNVIIHHEMVA